MNQADVDQHWMSKALELAAKAGQSGEVPVGALIVKDGQMVGQGANARENQHSPIWHAEMEAIATASQNLKAWRLVGCSLYVTLEPCVMCAGAICQARLDQVIFATHDPKAGAMGSLYHIHEDTRLNHRLPVRSGVLEAEASTLLKDFFKKRRTIPF